MSKKIDERVPAFVGKGVYENAPAIKSPWGRLVGYRDTIHYASQYNSIAAALTLEALRVVIPDYEERSIFMCECAEKVAARFYSEDTFKEFNVHPFLRGGFTVALQADGGDEMGLLPGRVNDFGTYRVEKELDVCEWAICGSELCRATIALLDRGGQIMQEMRGGPTMEFSMVEAIGCGDLHCRVVAENREKYPMPPRKIHEGFGPIATEDMIRFTPEEEMYKEPMFIRGECDYEYTGGTTTEATAESAARAVLQSGPGVLFIFPAVSMGIAMGKFSEDSFNRALKSVCEGAGKAAFFEGFAREGLRSWLQAPADVNDGRLLGGYIEMYLQALKIPYEIEAFNKSEVVYKINRLALSSGHPCRSNGLLYYWGGMARSLLSCQWFLWEEDSTEDTIRVKIAKKIDKRSE